LAAAVAGQRRRIAAIKEHVIVGPLSDISRAYKPDPVAYRTPAHLLGLDPGEVLLVAAHNGDLAAAKYSGLATGFVARPSESGPEQTADLTPTDAWDVAGSTLTELADLLYG